MEGKRSKHDGGVFLPEEIILEVLLRLPANALCRFRSVCKTWRALISDPAFVAAQRSRAGPLIIGQFRARVPEWQELRLLDKAGNVLRLFHVLGKATLAPTPCTDHLIFVDRTQFGATGIDPASGADFTVAGTDDPSPPWWVESPSFAGQTATVIHDDYSFGRAAPSGDYKVLRLHYVCQLVCSLTYERKLCEVATIMVDGGAVEQPTWRKRPWGPLSEHRSFSYEEKATVNGVLYFMPRDSYSADDGCHSIAVFDLESEAWEAETMRGPPLRPKEDNQFEEDEWHVAITKLRGNLCVVHGVQYLDSFGGHYANIWLLTDHDRSIWLKQYTIHMPADSLFTRPLDILGDGTVLLLLNAFWKAGNLESYHRYILQFYNSSTGAFTDFMEMAEGFNGRMAFYTGSSLLS